MTHEEPELFLKVTLSTFAQEKTDLLKGNLPEFTKGKFISGFMFPRWIGHTEENHIQVFTRDWQDLMKCRLMVIEIRSTLKECR